MLARLAVESGHVHDARFRSGIVDKIEALQVCSHVHH